MSLNFALELPVQLSSLPRANLHEGGPLGERNRHFLTSFFSTRTKLTNQPDFAKELASSLTKGPKPTLPNNIIHSTVIRYHSKNTDGKVKLG